MKKYSYKGPAGEVEIKDPIAVRLAESSWFLTLWTVGFMVWGGYYLYFAPPETFLGRTLSPGHVHLQNDCLACHQPFTGVPDESCGGSGCHEKIRTATIHNTMERPCISCHPEHTDGEFIKLGIGIPECITCHQKLEQDPKSAFYQKREDPRKITYVSREKFKHRSHRYPPFYKCYKCHCTGKGTIDVPMENLFLMESCVKCHEESDCGSCHIYHDQRDPRSRHLECIDEQFMPEMLLKTMGCSPYRERAPGFINLEVCETGEPAKDFGKTSPTEGAGQEPAPEDQDPQDQ